MPFTAPTPKGFQLTDPRILRLLVRLLGQSAGPRVADVLGTLSQIPLPTAMAAKGIEEEAALAPEELEILSDLFGAGKESSPLSALREELSGPSLLETKAPERPIPVERATAPAVRTGLEPTLQQAEETLNTSPLRRGRPPRSIAPRPTPLISVSKDVNDALAQLAEPQRAPSEGTKAETVEAVRNLAALADIVRQLPPNETKDITKGLRETVQMFRKGDKIQAARLVHILADLLRRRTSIK